MDCASPWLIFFCGKGFSDPSAAFSQPRGRNAAESSDRAMRRYSNWRINCAFFLLGLET